MRPLDKMLIAFGLLFFIGLALLICTSCTYSIVQSQADAGANDAVEESQEAEASDLFPNLAIPGVAQHKDELPPIIRCEPCAR